MTGAPLDPRLHLCVNRRLNGTASCAAAGAEDLAAALAAAIGRRGLDWRVERNACMGRCEDGPNLKAVPGGPWISGCRADEADALLDRLLTEWKKVP